MAYWRRPYTYAQYLDYIRFSPIWQEKRRIVFKRENYRCEWCCLRKPLHCHHTKEAYEYPLGHEPTDLLMALCEDCHAYCHGKAPRVETTPTWRELKEKFDKL